MDQKTKKRLLKNADNMIHEAMMKIAWTKYKEAEKICKSAIASFYREYTPNSYKRTYDLYNAYNLDVTRNGEFIFELGAEFMQKWHRVDHEYIFEKMFKEGWHGGADKGTNHPNPDKNYWRKPVNGVYLKETEDESYWWIKQAPLSTSPYLNIVNRWNRWVERSGKEMELDVWKSTFEKYIRR